MIPSQVERGYKHPHTYGRVQAWANPCADSKNLLICVQGL